jgi:hypothetical protein
MSILCGRTVLFFTQDKTCHGDQVDLRIDQFNDSNVSKIQKEIEKLNKKLLPNNLPIINSARFDILNIPRKTIREKSKGKKLGKILSREIDTETLENVTFNDDNMKKWREFLNPDYPSVGIIIVNANVARLEILLPFLKQPQKIDIVVDEADVVFSDKLDISRKMNEFFTQIRDYAFMVTATTATPLKLFFNEHSGLVSSSVIPVHPNYVGVNDLIWDVNKFNENQNVSSRKKVFDEIPELEHFIADVTNSDGLKVTIDKKIIIKSHIVPIVVSLCKKHHEEIHNHIVNTKYDSDNVSIRWNGDGIWLYSSALEKDGLREIIRLRTGTMKRYGKNYHIDSNKYKALIGDVFTWLRRNGGYKRFGHIFISTGKYADRSISYVCEDYIDHITKMVYLPSPVTPVSTMLQYLRILGIYSDKYQYESIVYTNVKTRDAIVKGYELTNTIIDKVGDKEIIEDFLQNCQFSGVLSTKKHMFNVPKSVTHIQTKFNVNQFIMDGNDSINWAYQTQNKILKELNVKKYTQKKSQYENASLGNLKRQEFQKEVGDYVKVLDKETKTQLIQKVHTINPPKEKTDSNKKQGKYIIVDGNKFGKGTQIREMIEDVHKIISEEGLIGKDIPVVKITDLMIKSKYRHFNQTEIYSNLWSACNRSKKLDKVNKMVSRNLYLWKEGKELYKIHYLI